MNNNIFYNIVLDTLFVIGLLGLIGGNLTVAQDLPIKDRRARVVGFILLLPLLSVVLGFTQWWDLLSAIIGIIVASVYLYWTTSTSEPKVSQFWLIAMIPVVSRYIVFRSANIWNSFVDFSVKLPLHGAVITYLPFFVFEIIIPVVIAFFVVLLVPVAKNKVNAFVFAVPVSLFHIHYSVLQWFVPFVQALKEPNGPFGPGIIKYFIADILAGLFLFVIVAFVAWLGSIIRLNKKLTHDS